MLLAGYGGLLVLHDPFTSIRPITQHSPSRTNLSEATIASIGAKDVAKEASQKAARSHRHPSPLETQKRVDRVSSAWYEACLISAKPSS